GLPGPCIHYIWSPRSLHSLYLVSPDPAFTISGLPGPAFTISGLPRLHIHYIWSPRTLHSLYLVSPDPAFTISGLPQYTEHGNALSQEKKNISSNTHQTEHVKSVSTQYVLSGDK
ncbi:unnamed protein product, partial [Staurois parvus]